MIETHPVHIPGRWRDGYALDVHTLSSTYLGNDEFGRARFDTKRSPAGDLLYRIKYQSEQATVAELAEAAAAHISAWQPGADLVVPVPASRQRVFQPVLEVGRALAGVLGLEFCDTCVRRTREVPELKDVFDYEERWRLLANLHEIDRLRTAGRKILLFDDLFRSGATMNSITAALYDSGGAEDVFALTITRTRSNQ